MNRVSATLIILLLVLAGCKTTEKTTTDADESPSTETENEPIFDVDPEVVEAYLAEEMDEFDRLLFENRSQLSDRFASVEHDMPDLFLKDVVQEEKVVDQYAGFRVQLLSTRSVAEADSTKDNFRVWADQHIQGYSPEAYVTFRQPYYKVRVGDFRDQQKANNFSRMVKDEYPAAWVVHDRIEPNFLPADTTQIEFVNQ
ncbi:SPOR domain-containing protein [Rhodohalobacter sulfatireducens]|uniref:SPOR domain-containing protein n=1 Tax=Rhodohalobacter sulfatireducens TaxID=2911366 RepID=A0ABS9KIF0_9BACT|nr:SPOR domain-containing protein [Rhodohalobacter sulfatireducens]MCG2590634.1 SPOR domain-containing protein [Rhodohalobacter sulfatireducens]